jgi:hypothetical protein
VTIADETNYLHQLGLSNELRGEKQLASTIQRVQSLLPSIFKVLINGKEKKDPEEKWNDRFLFEEMGSSGALQPLFETRTSAMKISTSMKTDGQSRLELYSEREMTGISSLEDGTDDDDEEEDDEDEDAFSASSADEDEPTSTASVVH